MEQQKMQERRSKVSKKKRRHLLHYLLIYLICLLAACITWLLVRYSMRAEAPDDCGNEASVLVTLPDTMQATEELPYVG